MGLQEERVSCGHREVGVWLLLLLLLLLLKLLLWLLLLHLLLKLRLLKRSVALGKEMLIRRKFGGCSGGRDGKGCCGDGERRRSLRRVEARFFVTTAFFALVILRRLWQSELVRRSHCNRKSDSGGCLYLREEGGRLL